MLKKWEKLPVEMQTDEVRKYYDILKKKKLSLFFKRAFDIFVSAIMLLLLLPLFLVLTIAIKIDSRGPVFYRQKRITQYNKEFRIFKDSAVKICKEIVDGQMPTGEHLFAVFGIKKQ